ncbi:hypothetical protein BDM02DRAFT_1525007 [Thelephora ganbajun]|uniref:Uncharacterized protein n=1 Tax=Thelephora ganbajun TaxID=370292 RepID=A0ACB6ZJS9_THEGA|nr:hypothetical protein BDM02DRAFT_1525007 [Thelephora ganbajun]
MSLKAAQTSRLMQVYLYQLKNHELRTKAITAGVLGFLQEVLARHLAGVPTRKVHPSAGPLEHLLAVSKVNAKAFKMGLFGFLVSAPLGHVLVKTMHKFFAGRSGPAAKLGMLATSLLVIAPIQIAVFLTNSAMVEGARTKEAILRVVKRGFAPVLGVTWITSPTAIVFAQTFLPPEFEVPFFNLVQFCTGLFFNTAAIKAALAAQKKEVKKE